MRNYLIALVILALAGCTVLPPNVQNAPPAYQAGFVDGEQSGLARCGYIYATFTKNTVRYQNDPQYRQGWNDGDRYGPRNFPSCN